MSYLLVALLIQVIYFDDGFTFGVEELTPVADVNFFYSLSNKLLQSEQITSF